MLSWLVLVLSTTASAERVELYMGELGPDRHYYFVAENNGTTLGETLKDYIRVSFTFTQSQCQEERAGAANCTAAYLSNRTA